MQITKRLVAIEGDVVWDEADNAALNIPQVRACLGLEVEVSSRPQTLEGGFGPNAHAMTRPL
jgi:hypothetical protein